MKGNLIGKLIKTALACTSFKEFKDGLAAMRDCKKAESLITGEFFSLEEFYQWTRNLVPPSEDRREQGSSSSKAMDIHPDVVILREECDTLRSRLEELIVEINELVHGVIPNLRALYELKIGSAEYELFSLQCRNAWRRRKLSLIQACLNRGEEPELKTLEASLEKEFSEWEERLEQKLEEIEKAREHMKSLWSEKEARDFKALYRKLVRLLHPDVNPGQGEKEKLLWHRMQTAYERGDLEEMRLVEVLLDRDSPICLLPEKSGLDTWKAMRERLAAQCARASGEIRRQRSSWPCTIEKELFSEKWVREKNAALREQIRKEKEYGRTLDRLLSQWCEAECHE
ncbi:MAG: hypothetical protein RDV48_14425 [Candidatus Eremiobacteraeota bacterium]|nr:hypothetical protein [Candidatus Eremiobacteraeota bacterium]